LDSAANAGTAISYGRDGKPSFWRSDGAAMGPNREIHLAFEAPDEDTVRAFHEAAVGLGTESLHAPRLWPEYHPGYCGAFVRDPDGNNIEAVCHTA
jgi:catechol 2,3-dioxygenase-like lactoylglutathione lyase family enzyme